MARLALRSASSNSDSTSVRRTGRPVRTVTVARTAGETTNCNPSRALIALAAAFTSTPCRLRLTSPPGVVVTACVDDGAGRGAPGTTTARTSGSADGGGGGA